MPELTLWQEAQRQLEICNACRYCEGYCAVFPALERRRTFDQGDMLYLSNLCHDCRDCYTACMYAPPHEFAVNIPALMSEIRLDVYQRYTSPRTLGQGFKEQKKTIAATVLLCLAVAFALVATLRGGRLFSIPRGAGSFYAVVPYLAMFIPAMAISLYVMVVLVGGLVRYWRDIGGAGWPDGRALGKAISESLHLTYLKGGGSGCDYPRAPGSSSRRILHHFLFYGLVCAFIATVLAAVYQDILGRTPPYPVLSLPVLFGLVGGIGVVVGATGMLALKVQSDPAPAYSRMVAADYAFLVLLDLVAISGILLLVLRDTRAMGIVLTLHLGIVLGLFITAPYGKFVHWVYRVASLVKNQMEVRDAGAETGH